MCKCATCLTAQVAKCVLGLVNSILITLGIILAVMGALIHFGGNFVYSLISSALAEISSSSVGSEVKATLSLSDLEVILGAWSVYVSYAGIFLLALGAFLAATGLLGTIGACCDSKIVLIVYIVVMAILALACAGFAVAFIVNKSQLQSTVSDEMTRLLKDQYKGRANPNEYTNIMDLVQARVPCCGINNYTDFYSVSGWNRTYALSDGSYIELVTPISCCKLSSSTMTPSDESCTYAPNATNSNYMSGGCYTKLWDAIDSASASVTYGLFIAAAVTGIIAGLAILIVVNAAKD